MAAIDEFVLWARHSQYADWWDRGDTTPHLKPFPTLDIKGDSECLNADFVFLCSEMGKTTGNEGGPWESVVYVKMDGEGDSEDGGDGEEVDEGVRLPRKVYIVDEEGVFHEAEEWVDEEMADGGNVEEEEDAELASEEAGNATGAAAPPAIKQEFMWVHDDDWESLGFPPKKKLGRSRYRYYVNGMDPVR